MIALSNASLPGLQARGIPTPNYKRDSVTPGVMHFGPGAFHRVHQAYYFDALLARDRRWGICEVALQSTGVRDALAPQDGLYTLCILDAETRFQVIGAAHELLVARESSEAVLQRMTAPTLHLITATVTEKGYCLTAQGQLDTAHADIQHDLSYPETPLSLVGYLAEGLRRRRAENLPAPNIVSCDNLTDNGKRLRRAVADFAHERDAELARWIEGEVAFPRTMVDSITPATDAMLRSKVAAATGIDDSWPVQREAFTQWVIDDTMRGVFPDWASVGVTVSADVDGYERAKLRLLNGAHSTLAYLGILAGFETVSEAMSDPQLARFIDALMQEIQTSVIAPVGLDLNVYIASLLRRFRNPALPHRLSQIAWDGSQKIPYRLLGTMRDNLSSGRPIERLAFSVAAWFHFIRRRAARRELAVDPLAAELNKIGSLCVGRPLDDVENFLTLRQVFPADLAADMRFRSALIVAYGRLDGVHAAADLQPALQPVLLGAA